MLPNKTKNPIKAFPKRGKEWSQELTEGTFPQNNSPGQGHCVAHPGVAAAKTEDQLKPCQKEEYHEQQIPQPPRPEWT